MVYMCNGKGSFTAELFQDYLRYIASIKSADEWAVIFCDCVATHLSVENLNFMHVNKIKLTPRPPNTSDKIQNEDLWTFWLLRNNGEYGYNKVKQQRLHYVAMAEGRTSLNFEDAMYCIKIPWELCMNQANNQIAWRKGGLRPFSRPPAVLVYMAGDEASGSGDGELGQRRERWWGGWCRNGDGRNRTAPLEEDAGHCTSDPQAPHPNRRRR